MFRKSLLLIALLLVNTFVFGQITFEQAEQILLQQLDPGEIGQVRVLLSENTVPESGFELFLTKEVVACPFPSTWVGFIDEEPMFAWAHDCRYVFIDANSGNIETLTNYQPPSEMNNFVLVEDIQYPTSPDPVPSSIVQPPSPMVERNNNLYAVILNAGLGVSASDDYNPAIYGWFWYSMVVA
ncbi:MAG: hypothetical protein K8R90_00615 [Candidatus Cloacimonetes bacterium]|nr:hypothetical protein [Candidatus Cloacimonadota bacterium]